MKVAVTHYEKAFQSFLETRRLKSVAIDQNRKALLADQAVKSFDFILYPRHGRKLLIDVKGRKLPTEQYLRGRYGQNWATIDDVIGLNLWQNSFGSQYQSVFIFAYWLYDAAPVYHDIKIHVYNQRNYIFIAADLAAYQRWMRTRSQSWQTVHVPTNKFAALALPLDDFLAHKLPRPSMCQHGF